jgi:S-adenosylmethionine decarboxylase
MQVGTEWLIDAAGCSPEALRDLATLRRLCERVLTELDLRVIGAGHWHLFPPPGGLTGLYLLTESHLACHSYPEHGVVTLNLHCCRARPRWCWESALRDALGAKEVLVREVHRGQANVSTTTHHSPLTTHQLVPGGSA